MAQGQKRSSIFLGRGQVKAPHVLHHLSKLSMVGGNDHLDLTVINHQMRLTCFWVWCWMMSKVDPLQRFNPEPERVLSLTSLRGEQMTRVFEPSMINGVVLFEIDGRQVVYRRDGLHYNSIGWIAERFGRWVNSLGQTFDSPDTALKAVVG